MRRIVSWICVGCFGAIPSIGMNESGSGGVFEYGARIEQTTIPVCCHELSSGRNHRVYAIHCENSRESIASISATVFLRCDARANLNCKVGLAFIPPPVS